MAAPRQYMLSALGFALIASGTQYLVRIWQPGLILVGIALTTGGAAAVWFASIGRPKIALAVGLALLGLAGVWAWNLHFWLDPTRVPPGVPFPVEQLIAPACLIIIGCYFAVFFRYARSASIVSRGPAPSVPATSGAEIPPSGPSSVPVPRNTAWPRLVLLASSCALALIVAHLAGITSAAERAQIIIVVIVLGAVATGLISEDSLQKILGRGK